MADVRSRNAVYHRERGDEADVGFFSHSNSRFFGPEKFYGPYDGVGGTFFVKVGRGGATVFRQNSEGGIEWWRGKLDGETIDDIRAWSRDAAKGLVR
jgi:hypothetical protein